MKEARRIDLYIIDMINSIERITEYTQGLDFQKFESHFMVVDAVARNFEIIGEAARKKTYKIKILPFHGRKCIV